MYRLIFRDKIKNVLLEIVKNEEYKINKNGNCIKLEKEVVKLINKDRKLYNKEHNTSLKQLKLKTKLKKSARLRSKEMFDNDYFSHTRPDGSLWDTVFDEEDINELLGIEPEEEVEEEEIVEEVVEEVKPKTATKKTTTAKKTTTKKTTK